MAKFGLFFSYVPASWSAMIDAPSDRAAAAKTAIERANGTFDTIYWMLGEWDGLVIFDAPSSIDAAAIGVSVRSTGAFERLETHELFEQRQLDDVLVRAKPIRKVYEPPMPEPIVFPPAYLPR